MCIFVNSNGTKSPTEQTNRKQFTEQAKPAHSTRLKFPSKIAKSNGHSSITAHHKNTKRHCSHVATATNCQLNAIGRPLPPLKCRCIAKRCQNTAESLPTSVSAGVCGSISCVHSPLVVTHNFHEFAVLGARGSRCVPDAWMIHVRVSAPNGQCDASGTFMLRRSHLLMHENHLRTSETRASVANCVCAPPHMRQFPFQFPYGSAESVFSAIKHVNNRVNVCDVCAMRK